MRQMLFATASAVALLIGGAGATLAEAGFTAEQLRQAQVELSMEGFYDGPLDGVAGPLTKRALQQYQDIHGLPVTAVLDQRTWHELHGGDQMRQPESSGGSGVPRNR